MDWSKDRIARLGTPDVVQLRANAQRLNSSAVMELCDQVLAERKTAARLAARENRKKLVAARTEGATK